MGREEKLNPNSTWYKKRHPVATKLKEETLIEASKINWLKRIMKWLKRKLKREP